VDDVRVRPHPRLFADRYVREAIVPMACALRNPFLYAQHTKSQWLLAAWGAYQPQLDRSPNVVDRGWAAAWVHRHRNENWVNSTRTAPADYWDKLPRFRFTLSPSGLDVQSLKAYESLLVGAIPIVHRRNVAYARLIREGWPMVQVDMWDNVTLPNMQRWWSELAPRAAAAGRCIRSAKRVYAMLLRGAYIEECINRRLEIEPS
jgi:hypothetical protein